MLVVSGANALGGLGAASPELTALRQRVDQCIRSFPITGADDAAAGQAASCEMFVGGTTGEQGIKAFEKVTLTDPADNALLFNIAQTLLTNWRNTGMGLQVSTTEANVRRIAALKLGEPAVFDSVSPTLAAQALSSAGRIESDDKVKAMIAISLYNLLKNRDIPASVRTEAVTTLKLLANPHLQSDPTVLNAANLALKALAPNIEIGPITVTTIKPPFPYRIPLIAMGITAVAATGGLVWFFRRRSAGLSGVGPLRRRAEAAWRRQKSR